MRGSHVLVKRLLGFECTILFFMGHSVEWFSKTFIDFFLPNVHCYFMKHVLLRDIYWFYLTSAFTRCSMCVCHMSLKDLLTYLLTYLLKTIVRSCCVIPFNVYIVFVHGSNK